MFRVRSFAAFLLIAFALCLVELRSAQSQTGLRRLTNTTEEGISLNPSLSGDGRYVAFETTEDVAGAGGSDYFRAIRAIVSAEPPTFLQMGRTRAVAPAISQDGSRIAFASRDNPLGTNQDGNSEIYLFDAGALRQITNTSPGDITNRVRNGNVQPSISDDGRLVAFSSNRDLVGLNPDGNLEIFIYDTLSQAFTQITNALGTVGSTDAKISGNGLRVAFIRDRGATPSTGRDLLLHNRTDDTTLVIGSNVPGLAVTYGRAISDDGTRIVYAAETAPNSRQVFLFDGRSLNLTRPITFLGARATGEVPLHPTISGDGSRIAFATRRAVSNAIGGENTDNSVELYTFDIPTAEYARVTPEVTSTSATIPTTEVISSLNDQGTLIAFNFPRVISGPTLLPESANNSEIYVTATAARPTFGTLSVLNGASFGNEPSSTKAVAPNSIAVGIGGDLATTTEQAQRQQNGTFPTNVGGTTVRVNNRLAQIFFVSPTQVNFLVPPETEIGTADVFITNAVNFETRGKVTILRAAPGVFTFNGDGRGEGVILDADTLQPGPFDPSNGQRRLIVFATGVRNATQVSVTIGGRFVTVESVMPSSTMPGLDEIHLLLPADLRGAGTVELVVRADGRDSNPVTVTITGDAQRDIVINELLADPPDGINGDANHDGVRDSNQDEFVEIVNATAADIDISGFELSARGSGASDTLRHKFAPNTILPARAAIVVFGGGNFDPNNAVFGGAQVVKASTGSLSLVNSGGVVTLRDTNGAVVSLLSYGGSTGINADANQSVTRSPDVTGNFTGHLSAEGSAGRAYSPGTRVNGSPFLSPAIARIEVTPASPTIFVGQQQQFTAQAFDSNGNVLSGVIFIWQSSNPAVATINQNGIATGVAEGTTEIRASARGVQSAPATLTVNFVPRVLTRIEVTPSPASIPVGGGQTFTARAFDQFDNEITGVSFTWSSSDPNIATIDQTGLALGVSQGQTTITASAQNVSGTATLNVTPATVVINEVLADPPGSAATDLQGDANHDNTRSSSDDEFVELVNSTSASINISGWTLRTRATGSATENLRHTFDTGRTIPAGEAIVVFGGGNFDATNPLFGCAQVVKASSGGLSLTNGGLTVIVRDSAGDLITQFAYGGTTGLSGDSDQSLTRSPDITGNFVLHTTASGAAGRRFSPGTKVNGTPFGSCPARLTTVTISPPSASVLVGQSTQFTAQAFDQFGNPIPGATITFASDNTSVANIASVTTDPATGIATATVTGQTQGTAHITAQSTDGTTTVTSSQSTLTVNTTTTTFSVTGQVKDNNNNPVSGVLITFEMNFQGTLSTTTTQTDANGNYSSGDLGCQNTVKVTPSKTGLTFTPSAVSFVNSSQCLTGNETANFTAAPPPPGTLVISQVYGGGGNASATFSHDFVEIFNSGTTTVDFAVTPYSIQYAGTSSSFGSTSAANKTNITSGTIAPGQYFLVQGASGGAVGIALPTPDATGSLAMAATGGKVALVVGTTALPASTCPGDDGASPFNPANSTIADFVGYGSSANAVGHCYEGPGPAPAPSATSADFRKAGGCVDTNFNTDDFLVAGPNPRNSGSPLNNCSGGLRPEITINDRALSESTTPANFTVTLSVASTLTVTVDYSTANGTATAGADYTAVSGTLTFAPGETTKTINVPITSDTLDEANETYFVNLSNASNSTILDGQGQGTINDNDNEPSLSINDASVAEGDNGTTNATFTLSLSAASGQIVTVNYATADGTATAGSDYQTATGTVTFNPGETTQTVSIPVNGDTTFEPNETFFVNLTTPTNATIADNQGQGTITNDDAAPPVPAFLINDVSIAEGNSGTKTLDFTVSVSMNPAQAVSVDYATADGTATAPTDYQAASGTVTFNPGDPLSKTISVTINGDTLVESDETFFVNLTNPSGNSIIADNQGVGTITNDDPANLVISQIYGGGGLTNATRTHDFVEIFNRGTTTINFAVTPYSIQYAGAASNFGGATSTSLTPINSGTIAPGQYFLVQEASGGAVGAALPTPDATGSINLAATAGKVALVAGTTALSAVTCPGDDGIAPFNPNNSTIADFVGYGTTAVCYEGSGPAPAPSNTTADFRKAGGCTDTNDNAADFLVFAPNPRNSSSPLNNCSGGSTPNLTINDVTVTEGNSGTVTATFTVSLSSPANGADVTFDISTADGTAQDDVPSTEDNDYVARSLTNQIIPVGQQTYTFTVTVNGDTNVEANETFFVNVANVTGATVTDGQGMGTITNDDLPSLSINDVTQSEGNSGTSVFTFTVSLSSPAPAAVTFDIATADGTAQDGTPVGEDNDYVAKSETGRTIAAGQQTFTFDVTVNGDLNIEPNETFFVNVTNISGATVGDAQGLGTIQNDDSPSLSVNDVSLNEGNAGTTTFSFNVHLSLPAGAGGVTFDIATADGTAQDDVPSSEDNDYVARSLTGQTIPEGSQDYTFDVTVNGDTMVEPNETFFVNVTNVSGATVSDAKGQGTILNDDAANLVISQIYGGGGNANAIYTHDFVEIFNRGTTTINFAVTPYSIQYAGATSNFGGTAASVKTDITSGTIGPGQYFLIQGASTAAIGVALPTPDVTGSIAMALGAGKVALVSGTAALPANSCPGDDLSTLPTNPSGNNIVDFVGYGTTAACYEGSGPAPAPSATVADFRKAGGCTDTENNAADFLVATPHPRNISSPTNDCIADPTPNLTINDVTVTEGNSGSVFATFTVSLSSPASSTDVTFDIATQNNTASSAAASNDYEARSATGQVIPAGAQTYTFTVEVNGDTALEPDESFFVNVTNVSGANLLDGQGVGTIQNDDFPTLTINDVSLNEGNAGTTTFTFTVSLSAPAAATVTFDIATADGTAQDGTPLGEDTDYVAKSETGRTITAGQQTATFTVTVNGDMTIEQGETFFVNVTNVTGATVSDAQGLGTIQNDDSPAISINDVTLNEGDSGTTAFTFTISLSTTSIQTVTVNYATADNTATAPSDYTAIASTQISFAPGETIKSVTVQVNGDTTTPEGNETFFVNLSGETNATIADGQGVGTITNDDASVTSADLSVTKTDSPDLFVAIGNDITYTITVTNNGPDAASSAVMADTVPTNTTFRSITTPAGWACGTVPAVGGTGSISCTNPSFSVGSSSIFTLVVRVNAAAPVDAIISNTASVSSSTTDSNGGNNSATQTTTVKKPLLVISQLYPGGGNAGATYMNDFIEIFNRGTTTVDFSATPYSVQYTSQAGNFGGTTASLKTDITSGTIAPGQYFLIQGASGGANGVALPTTDAPGSIAMSATAGKVALVLGTAALPVDDCPGDDNVSPFNPNNAVIVDFVGYGGTAASTTCYEGSGPAPFSTSTAGGLDPDARSTIRTSSCTDTNVNSTDFSNPTTAPTARNKATPASPCP